VNFGDQSNPQPLRLLVDTGSHTTFVLSTCDGSDDTAWCEENGVYNGSQARLIPWTNNDDSIRFADGQEVNVTFYEDDVGFP